MILLYLFLSFSREARVDSPLSPLNLRSMSRGSSTGSTGGSSSRPWSRQSRPSTQETGSTRSRAVSRGSSTENLMRPLSRQLTSSGLSRQGSFRGSRPSTQGSMEMRPDTPETDDSGSVESPWQSEARRWRKMWPKIVQTNDAAILKAKAMAKNLGSIGKDMSEVQSSLWKNKANKNMMGFSSGSGTKGGSGGGSIGRLSSPLFDQNVLRKVFVDLDALNRPMSADISGTGLDIPIVSFKREGGFSMERKRQRHQQQQQQHHHRQQHQQHHHFTDQDRNTDMHFDPSMEEFEEPTRADLKKRNRKAILKIERQRIQEEENEEDVFEDL